MGKWYTESDLRDFEPIWILQLDLGGKIYRFATETISIDHDSGSYLYDGTLSDVDVTSEMEFLSEDFDLPSAGVTVTFKDDLAKLIAQIVDFGSATAELSLFRKGSDDDSDDRQVLIAGRIDAPSYGAIGEPVSFNIEADWLRNSKMIPGPEGFIDQSVNWPDADDNSQGMIYPTIIGAPGSQNFSGAPVYIIDGFSDGHSGGTVHGLIAGHPVTAGTIKVLRVLGTTGAASSLTGETVSSAMDSNGQFYSYVTLTGQYTQGDSFFAHFNEGGGGLINPFRTESTSSGRPGHLTGGGDLIRYFLHQSGVKVDDGKTEAAAALLNAFEFSGYIAERVDVMSFLKDEIIPLLPCSLRASSEGLYPVVWRFDATESDAKTSLIANQDIFRDGLVEYQSTEVFNEISLQYRHNARFNTLQKQVTITGDLSKGTSGFLWRNQYTVSSHARYGKKSLELETEFIASRATAGRVINWMSRAYCAKHRKIKYQAPFKFGYLQVGDVVSLTDSDLSFVNQIVLIQAVEWAEDGLNFEFLLIPDIPRDTIPTG